MDALSDSGRPPSGRMARLSRHPLIRIFVALLFIAIPFALVAIPFNLFVTDRSLKRAGALLLTAIILGAYYGYVRIIEKRAVTELSPVGAMKEFMSGLAIGALLFSLTIGVLGALGVYQVTGSNGAMAMLATLPAFAMGGVLEELVVRGVVFRIVEQSLGSWIALLVSAVLFGLLHLLNPGTTLLNAGAVVVEAGILLAAAFMVTRRLWLCMGIHIAWNFTQGGIFSSSVSGGAASGLLQGRLVGADWITGGTFGPEASIVAVTVCSAAGILAVRIAFRNGRFVRPFWSRQGLTARAA